MAILKRDLNEKVLRYTHLEIKNITIDENRILQEVVFLFLQGFVKSLVHALRGLIENFKSIS